MEMNVRRWLYGFIDQDGTKHKEEIRAASKRHAARIIATRIKNNSPLVDRSGFKMKACHAKRIGRIVCTA